MPLALSISPHGRPSVEDAAAESQADGSPSPVADGPADKRIRRAFGESPAEGLLHLATVELQTHLPPPLAFARDFGREYLTALCHTPGLDPADPVATIDVPPVPPPAAEHLAFLALQAPPMRGLEYLSAEALAGWWVELDGLVREQAKAFPGGVQAYLRDRNPLWRLVGRLTFHLAENKRDPSYPFAFMATYASRLSAQGRVQHQPLGRALQEYAGAKNHSALLALLEPLKRASERNEWVKELVDSNNVYHPLGWSPREAYRFLQQVPALEEAGLIVRVPDWWKAKAPPRPVVSVKVGDRAKGKLGVDALLDFSVGVTIDGERLTEDELRAVLESSGGLVPLKGKWVEVDKDKLDEALKHWKNVEREAKDGGLSFFEGMRLLAGAPLAGDAAAEAAVATREWTGIEAGDALERTLAELRDPDVIGTATPPDLKATLRPYQQTGVNWLRFMTRLGLGACLADDMGLGKTIQVISLLLHRKRDKVGSPAPSLLVVPASLIANWKAELARFAPNLSAVVAHPSEGIGATREAEPREGEAPAEPASQREPAGDGSAGAAPCRQARKSSKSTGNGTDLAAAVAGRDLVITTYGMVSRLEELRKHDWGLVILDEAQAIKNSGTRQTKAVKEVKAAGRIVLTGTPVENRLSDLWSLFDFLNPGLLGNAKAFGTFAKGLAAREHNQYGPLRTLVRPYILRRLKTDKRIIADLPDKTEVNAFCGLSKRQAALYEQAVRELAEQLKTVDGMQRRGIVLAYLMRLKQICNHPSQLSGDGDYAPEHSGKFQRIADLCEELAERQEKALVFTQFREISGPLADHLAGVFGRPGLVLHGGTAVGKRRELVESFQRDDGPPFFVLSLKAGGTGLNLTAANHVIHFDRWWNPAVENQATDRAFRIGQKRNVLVHKFVCRGTVEDKIDELIAQKTGMARELLDDSGGGEVLLTEMDNDRLLKFVALDIRKATES